MPHVTFIHGLANKPEAESLHRIWRRALARGAGGLDLGSSGVTSSMVYWADVLYAAPDPNVADHESTAERTAEQVDGGGDAEIPIGDTEAERTYLAAARARMTRLSDAEIAAAKAAEQASPPVRPAAGTIAARPPAGMAPTLERIPLPWWIKERIMKAYIRDAYLYLFDKRFSPRPGVSYEVRQEIRRRFLAALRHPQVTHPHVVVSHSMGTMVAYDCLKRVPASATVDALITLGSPLGVDEVQDKYKPEWSRADGFPGARLGRDWVNIFDRLDVVCGADPALANDFRAANVRRIVDTQVRNDGAWRHSVVKYLARSETRQALGRALGLA